MKKRGFSLMELLVVILITLILISTAIKTTVGTEKIVNEIRMKSIVFDITNIFSFAKHYCYKKENRGRVEISKTNGTIRFIDDEVVGIKGIIRSIALPKGYFFLEDFSIPIGVNGVIGSKTIWLKDSQELYHKITIAVGVDIISVY